MSDVANENINPDNIPTAEKPKRATKKVAKKAVTKKTVAATAGDASEAPTTGRKKKYINNADLMTQIALSKEQDKMTDELAKMLFMLVQRYAKHPDYANIHSYKMDMEAFANLTIVRVWRSFNPEKSNNPFAYFTQIIRHAFYQYLNQEKKQRETKDLIRIDIGEAPSFTYMENYREERDAEYDEAYEDEMLDDDGEARMRRPGYDATLPGEVTEINYSFTREDDMPEGDLGDIIDVEDI